MNLSPCFLKKHSPNRPVYRATESWLVVLYWEPVIKNYWSLNSIYEQSDKIYASLVDLLCFYSKFNSFWNFSCCRQDSDKVAISKLTLMYVIWTDVFSKHIKLFCIDFTSSLPLIVMFVCYFSSILERISFWSEIRISPRFSFCNYAVDFVERSFDLSIVSVDGLSHDIILSLNPFTMLNYKNAVRFATDFTKVSLDQLSVFAH
jgi:hypothetical protein